MVEQLALSNRTPNLRLITPNKLQIQRNTALEGVLLVARSWSYKIVSTEDKIKRTGCNN